MLSGWTENDVTIHLRDSKKSFRCQVCGSNIFRRHRTRAKYKCNGCDATYSEGP